MRLTKILIKFSKVFIAMLAVIIQLPASAQKSEKNEAYLFTYFTGNGPGEEAIRFAVSFFGHHCRPRVKLSMLSLLARRKHGTRQTLAAAPTLTDYG